MDYSSTFIRPYINIGYGQDRLYGVNSLPELIEFDARHNPNHTFALQARPGDLPAREITFSELQTAVENACAWLVSSGATVVRSSRETKVPPVAILMGSDVGIFIYMAALNRLGTPVGRISFFDRYQSLTLYIHQVLCLSARLTPVAIAHLITETHPSTVLISAQVARAAKEAEDMLLGSGGVAPKFNDAIGYMELIEGRARQPVPPKYEDFRYGDRDSLILHSSGTTGLPKAVWHAHAFILTNGTNHNLPPRPDAYPVNLSTLPLYHVCDGLDASLLLTCDRALASWPRVFRCLSVCRWC